MASKYIERDDLINLLVYKDLRIRGIKDHTTFDAVSTIRDIKPRYERMSNRQLETEAWQKLGKYFDVVVLDNTNNTPTCPKART